MTEPISVFDEMEQYKPIPLASKWQRFANYLIDLIICYIFTFIIAFILIIYSESTGNSELYTFLIDDSILSKLCQNLFFGIVTLITYTLMEGLTKGRSAGKLITGTRAVKEDGSTITWKNAFLRSLYRFIPFEQFSIFSESMWHDRGPKTMVIRTRGV